MPVPVPVPSAAQTTKDSALPMWQAACAHLDLALAEIKSSRTRSEKAMEEAFDVALRALYALEAAFFPEQVCADIIEFRERASPKSASKNRA